MEFLNDSFQRMEVATPTSNNAQRFSDGASVKKNRWGPKGTFGKENNTRDHSDSKGTFASGKSLASGKEHNNRTSKKSDPRRHSDSSGRRPGSAGSITKPTRIHFFELFYKFDSIERAKKLHDACLAKDSMLKGTLRKLGLYGSDEHGRSNINSSNMYKVHVRTTAVGKQHNVHSVVLELNREMTGYQKSKLLEVFAKHDAAGFVEWLGGAKGWRFDCPTAERASWRRRFAVQLNTLQSVFTLFAQDDHKYFFTDEKRTVWRKQAELTESVSDVRVWIERIEPSDVTRQLLRNSNSGPDVPVHWAHHHPQTNYPLSVVSESTMMELVAGLVKLFQKEFHHSKSDPLGKRWRNHEKRRLTDWVDAAKVCPEWTEDHLEDLLGKD